MTRTNARRRPGISLLEVMVSMFIMAIGMVALFTLFPLGALQMAKALKDSRAAETCSQADTAMRLWWQLEVVEPPQKTPAQLEDSAFTFLDNPGNGLPTINGTATGPSYPVAIDPIGWQAYPGARQKTVAQLTGGLLPRRSVQTITNQALTLQPALSFRACSLMDDITFGENALPDTTATGVGAPVVRQGRYNWAAVIQRQNNNNRYTADLKILVFDGRPPGVDTAGAEVKVSPAGAAARGTSQLILVVGATPPESIRKGGWIMDGTLDGTTGTRNAVWYRIQGIDADSIPNQFIIDLQTPLTRDVTTASQFYAFKGLLEVFDRPPLTASDSKPQVP